MKEKRFSDLKMLAVMVVFFLLGKGVITFFQLIMAAGAVFVAYYMYASREAAEAYVRESRKSGGDRRAV